MTDLVAGAAPAASEPAAIANVQTAEVVTPSDPIERMGQTMEKAYDKINPPRENGKFIAKDKPAEVSADPKVDAPPVETELKDQNPAEVKVEPPKTAAIDAPLSWSAEMKAKWAALPPDAQTYIAQREGEAHKRISELGQQVKTYEPYRQLEEHFSDVLQKNGLRGPEAAARMFAVERMLAQNPEDAVRQIAEAYGVNLSGGQQTAHEPGQESGEVRALKAEISQLKRAVGETASKVTARERSEAEREQAALDKQIADFAKDKPHFEKVRGHMAGLMQAGAAADLNDAYDMAVHAHPEIRKALLAEQKKADDEKAEKERAEKAKEAKRNASMNVKSTPSSPKRGSWEETMDSFRQ